MSVGAFVLDAWAALSFKRDASRRLHSSERSLVAPGWVGDEHRSRIEAYLLLAAYFANVARFFSPAGVTEEDRRAHREYGDAALLVRAVRSAVLGETISLAVEGAGDDPGDEPEEPGPEASPEDRAAWAAEHAEWSERRADADAASERLAWLERWASPEVERLTAKVLETELDAQKLGDGVYVLGWSNAKRRCRLRLYDPAAYFPVLDPGAPEDEFPRRVHVAWSFERRDPDGTTRTFVRRLTWRLGPIMPVLDEEGLPVVDERSGSMRLIDGDRLDPERGIVRDLPYADEPTDTTCYLSDGEWEVLEGRTVDDLTDRSATWAVDDSGVLVRDLDLGIDFIPVVHLPNTVAIKGHYGEALITALAQLLDDLAAADTDAAKAADLVGTPMIGASGVTVGEEVRVTPGVFLGLGPEGKLSVVDLSSGLKALHEHVGNLLDRLTTNARVPDSVLGRVEPQAVSSGLHMLLTFGPLRQLVGEQRLVRDEKYPLLVKMVQRWALVAGAASVAAGREVGEHELDPRGPGVLPARVEFGSFLPSDEAALVERVVALYKAKLISRKRALTMLVEGGVLDLDVEEELEAVEAEDFEAALALLEATGDAQAVGELLRREVPELPESPPGAPGGPVPPFPGTETAPEGGPAALGAPGGP